MPPPPGIPEHHSREGQGETEARSTQQPCLAPCTWPPSPMPEKQGRGGGTGQAPPPSRFPQHRAAGMAPEPARGRGPTRHHPVVELVPLGPTAAGAAPAGDSARGRPCPGLHRPPGPGTGWGGPPPHPDPRGPPRRRVPRGTHAGTARERARAPVCSGAGDVPEGVWQPPHGTQRGSGETEARREPWAGVTVRGGPRPGAHLPRLPAAGAAGW